MGSTAAMNIGNLTNQPGLGNLLQVGLGYGLGITFAITICAMTSGGHFNPAVTLAFAKHHRPEFPWTKVPRFIFAQIMGAFVATLLVYGQYRPYILVIPSARGVLSAEIFSAVGPAGILAIYSNSGIPLKWVFLNEFFVDIFLGLVIWGVWILPIFSCFLPLLPLWLVSPTLRDLGLCPCHCCY
ncbi:hypothetical protein BS47DRAFT_1423959 [Hydnum rufescens UP504]|uniref:Aquaporin n=1 Tax=Hydnum rufescens UP504 TaxID=1448309 RepID=A0A9P6DMP0_9AGAM|nr:hypothetical protein BS47DRAFT_1423959 [Hydnum rufescens UP504]